MSKSSNKPLVSTQQTTLPSYVTGAQENLLAQGNQLLLPRIATPGVGVATFNNDQGQAFQGYRDMAAQTQAEGGVPVSEIQRYLNPYTRDVVDTTNQTLRDESDRTVAGIRAREAASSAFGGSGSRAALQESEAARNLERTMASTTAQLMAQGYDKATATAITAQGLRRDALAGLQGVGDREQAQAQTELDSPLKALQMLQEITPQQLPTNTTITQPNQAPGMGQQLAGLGLGLLGLRAPGGGSLGGSLFNLGFGKT